MQAKSFVKFAMLLFIGNILARIVDCEAAPSKRPSLRPTSKNTMLPTIQPTTNTPTTAPTHKKLNVLLIYVDDLGIANKDSIANHSFFQWAGENTVEFTNIYTGVAVCAPGRHQLFSARALVRSFENNALKEVIDAGAHTIAGEFAANGYTTTARGKSVHPNELASMNYWREYTTPAISNTDGANAECPQQRIGCINANTLDQKTTSQIISLLREYSAQKTLFFLVYGLNRPHLLYTCTAQNFNKASSKINIENTDATVTAAFITKLQATGNLQLPIRVPKVKGANERLNVHNFYASKNMAYIRVPIKGSNGKLWKRISELRGGWANQNIDIQLIMRYERCAVMTTFDLIDSVRKEIYRLGLAPNTIVVLTADHGTRTEQRGYDTNSKKVETGFGYKNTVYKDSAAIPLVMYVPKLTNENPGKTKVHGNSFSIFPTLSEIAYGKAPNPGSLPIHGKSLAQWVINPEASAEDSYAISQYPRGPKWLVQDDPLMDGDEPCNPNKPLSGRAEWCMMSFVFVQNVSGIEYQYFVAFDYYEVRRCSNPGPGNLFENGSKSWQIMPGSCVDYSSATQEMLISDAPQDLGQNLLFGAPNPDNRAIADNLLARLKAAPGFKEQGCVQKPVRPNASRCLR